MIYSYLCHLCESEREVIKPVSEYDNPEQCPVCTNTMDRVFAPKYLYFNNTAVQERVWNPAFGKAMTQREAQAEAKTKGLIEVGTERPEKHLTTPRTEYPSFTNDDLRAILNKP